MAILILSLQYLLLEFRSQVGYGVKYLLMPHKSHDLYTSASYNLRKINSHAESTQVSLSVASFSDWRQKLSMLREVYLIHTETQLGLCFILLAFLMISN
jgi:hypothetical protein